MSSSLDKLQAALEFEFSDAALLDCALTHRSASYSNNERLEFLGDSILNFTIASELFNRYPKYTEGDLSRLRATLVDKSSLAEHAKSLQLGDYLRLGGGELKSGGWRRDSILADAVEAIIGAIYLDAGIEAAQRFILGLYEPHLKNLPCAEELKDPKTRLQEWLQARKFPLPTYSMVGVKGKPHEQIFSIQCEIPTHKVSVMAEGTSRRKAEQAAANEALTQLQKQES